MSEEARGNVHSMNYSDSKGSPRRVEAVIVGAGFAGLYMLFRLREIGVEAHVYEAADDVGGVWYWNRYPGARCDVVSMEYSYSFSNLLQQEWHWSERFATQPEILSYLQHVADRFELRRNISFSTRVVSAIFDETVQLWEVHTDRGERVLARHCIMASGSLSVSRLPDFPGIESFAGEIYHTGEWPHAGVDFAQKKVAVVGTGSSGVQSIPLIAEQAQHVVVFQRTPNFVVPARNCSLDENTIAAWKKNYPELRERAKYIGTFYEFSDKKAMEVSAQEREAEFRRRWRDGGVNFTHAFKDIYLDLAANDTAADFVRARIHEIVADPLVATRLCPKDHPLGAKRICVGSDYYETYNRANVTLVDLRDTPIVQVAGHEIRTTTESFNCDAIVCATGYDALTGALTRIDIQGRGGAKLKDKWSAGPRNYLGLMSAGFPNFFIITGPGSPSVLVNMVIGIEQHVDWIANCILHLRAKDAATIEPVKMSEDDWVQYVNDEADLTLFPRANSWYIGANIPGKPRVFLPFVGGIGRYRKICDEVAAAGYSGFEIAGSAGRSPAMTGG